MNSENEKFKRGIICGLSCYMLWGVLPIYWKNIEGVSALEILANRVFWSVVFVALIIAFQGKWQDFLREVRGILGSSKKSVQVLLASLMISLNWGIFIWAVNEGKIVESSMGNYINPLANVLLGVVFFGEKLDKWTKLAVFCATIGVLTMVIRVGYFPWVALSLVATFTFYAYIKKTLTIEAKTSVLLEALLATPFGLAYVYYLASQGLVAWQIAPAFSQILLVGSGAATALPLILFTAGAKMLPLSVLGFLQYLSPSISLVIGVFMYKEPFTFNHLLSFGFIWLGLLIFSLNQILKR